MNSLFFVRTRRKVRSFCGSISRMTDLDLFVREWRRPEYCTVVELSRVVRMEIPGKIKNVMITSWNGKKSSLLALCEGNLPVTGGFHSQGQWGELWCNRRLSKQSRRQWFEAPAHSLWRHCNTYIVHNILQDTTSAFSSSSAFPFDSLWKLVLHTGVSDKGKPLPEAILSTYC